MAKDRGLSAPLVSICPVCCAPIQDNLEGVGPTVKLHNDGVGRICPMSGQPMPPWDERGTREACKNRSGGVCEFCMTTRATEMHHRKSRGVGGEWHPANILHLCSGCHAYITHHPEWSYQLGLMVRSYDDPAEIAVTQFNGTPLYLSDEVTPPQRRNR